MSVRTLLLAAGLLLLISPSVASIIMTLISSEASLPGLPAFFLAGLLSLVLGAALTRSP